jgi:adenine-specific DNA-methyltransferase
MSDQAEQHPQDTGAADGHRGRLELTWTEKERRLVSRNSGDYAWVPPSDHRVAEVRLLHDAGIVGSDPEVGILIRGDALHGLASLAELEPYRAASVGTVKLAYLDPPFNTAQTSFRYFDGLEHSIWLTMMRDRLLQIRELLSEDGSVWVHCDDSEHAYLKVMMDEVFGRQNFVGTIVWQKAHSRRNDASFVSVAHDYIVVFARNIDHLTLNRLDADEAQRALYTNPDGDPRGDWISVPFHAPNVRPNLTYEITGPTGKTFQPPRGRCWSMTKEKFDALRADDRIYFGPKGEGVPRRKKFWDEEPPSTIPWTWWSRDDVGDNQEATKEAKALVGDSAPAVFATPKPERLLQRIVAIASSPGDLVLDCYLGSGTAAAVAHKMGRRWIGVELDAETLDQFAIPRMEAVVRGEEPGGITNQVGWKGGGGFRIFDVGASMFEDDLGDVVLAEWATNGKLAAATAAQLHFSLEVDPPFCGRKGRHRLAVIDGLVSEDVVHLLAARLDENEQLTLCGTSVDPAAIAALTALRPGSRVKKIPASLLADYQQSGRWKAQTKRGNAVEQIDSSTEIPT